MISQIRDRIIGTLSIIGFLLLIFQLEVLLTAYFGYPSSKAMLSVLPVWGKKSLVAIAGPFLHRGPGHLVGNLGILLLAGGYLEYAYTRSAVYRFSIAVGYLAAWVPLFLGWVGAIGASGITYGLGVWVALHAGGEILKMAYEPAIDWRVAHILPLLFGVVQTSPLVSLLLNGSVDSAGEITHLIGAYLGLLIGTWLTLNRLGVASRIRNES